MNEIIALSPELEAQWDQVRGLLRAEVGDAAFNSWLKPLVLAAVREGQAVMTAPTRFMRDWVVSHYGDRLSEFWLDVNPEVRSVYIHVKSAKATKSESSATQATPQAPAPSSAPVRRYDEGDGQAEIFDVGASLDPRFTFDNFVVGKPNELAYAASRRVADPAAVPFNPLFLYGGVGLGKTHLMHAIAAQLRALNPERKVLYLSAEKVMYQFIRALRDRQSTRLNSSYGLMFYAVFCFEK